MPFTPEEIELKEFSTTIRGYDMEEVQAFLRAVADDVRRSERGRQVWSENLLEELGQLTRASNNGEPTASQDVSAERGDAVDTLPPLSWRGELDRTVARTDERMARWIEDQRTRLIENLGHLLRQVRERRMREAEAIDAWRISERARLERMFVAEQSAFHERLLEELKAFEEQLVVRLLEQEERLARWWDEAEQIADRPVAPAESAPPLGAETTSK